MVAACVTEEISGSGCVNILSVVATVSEQIVCKCDSWIAHNCGIKTECQVLSSQYQP
jgi:hypothetical protein